MKARSMAVAVAAVVVCGILASPVLAQPAADEAVTRVFKYVGTRNGRAAGKPMTILRVAQRFGGTALNIDLPDGIPGKDALAGAKADEYVKVSYSRQSGRLVASQVDKHELRPGEDDPEACEFVAMAEKTAGGQTFQAALVLKAEKEVTLLVPNIKNDQGEFVPDEALLERVRKLAAGDLLDVLAVPSPGGQCIKDFWPYKALESAAFVKVGTERVEGGPALTTVEIKKDDQAVTLYLPVADNGRPADPSMVSRTRSLRAGQAVLYKAAEQDGKSWLIDIRPGPKTTAGTLTGTFVWTGKPQQVNDLTVELTPTGPNEYSAVYTFKWGSPMTYKGSIKGNLRNGEVTGDGTGDGRRTFVFEGTAKNGVIEFKHYETTGGRKAATGTGTMRL